MHLWPNIIAYSGYLFFFDETEKKEPVPQPRKNTLKPPTQIEVEDASAQTQRPEEMLAEEPVVQNMEEEAEVKEVIEYVGEEKNGRIAGCFCGGYR